MKVKGKTKKILEENRTFLWSWSRQTFLKQNIPTIKDVDKLYSIKTFLFYHIHSHNTIHSKELVSKINKNQEVNTKQNSPPNRKMGKKLNRYFTRHSKASKHIWKVLNHVTNQWNKTKATLRYCYMTCQNKLEDTTKCWQKCETTGT